MNDPLQYILWHLLSCQNTIVEDELYAWDSSRAQDVMRAAHMNLRPTGYWVPTPETMTWYQDLWSEIRREKPLPILEPTASKQPTLLRNHDQKA